MGSATGVVKCDGAGSVLWSSILSGGSFSQIAVNAAGDVVSVGKTLVYPTAICSTGCLHSGLWVAKFFGSNGNVAWQVVYREGVNPSTSLTGISAVGVAVVSSSGDMAISVGVVDGSTDKSFFIVSLDNSGNLRWYSTYSGYMSSGVGVDASGSVFVAATSTGTGSSSNKIESVLKVASNGTNMWTSAWGSTAVDVSANDRSPIAVSPSGLVVVPGTMLTTLFGGNGTVIDGGLGANLLYDMGPDWDHSITGYITRGTSSGSLGSYSVSASTDTTTSVSSSASFSGYGGLVARASAKITAGLLVSLQHVASVTISVRLADEISFRICNIFHTLY